MPTGTICDLESEGLYGLIDADDGRIVSFNLLGVEPSLRHSFTMGTRVEFIEYIASRSAHVATLLLLAPSVTRLRPAG